MKKNTEETIEERAKSLMEVDNVIPTSSFYDDGEGKHYACDYIHLTEEKNKTFLVTEWRPNHFSPDRFTPIKKQQKLMKKSYIFQQLCLLLERQEEGDVVIDNCSYCTKKEMLIRHKDMEFFNK